MPETVIKKVDAYSVDEIYEALRESIEALGGAGKFFKSGMTVALKPNLVMKKESAAAVTTHPAIVAATGRIVRDAGAYPVLVESPGGPFSRNRLKSVYDATGMTAACEQEGIALNFDVESGEIRNENARYLKTVSAIKAIIEADAVINLPKLKTHGQMVYTGAVKNMFGMVPGILKAEHHFRTPNYDEFADCIIDIFLAGKPVLNIMDAIVAMEGHGPSGGEPRKLGCMLVSADAFHLDHTACRMINLDWRDVPVLKQAVSRGLLYPDSEDQTDVSGFFCRDFHIPSRDNPKVIDFSDRTPSGRFIKLLKPKPVFRHKKCVLCGECVRSCPAKVLSVKDRRIHIELDGCIRCYCCQELCPEKAVDIKRGAVIDAALKLDKILRPKK